MKIDLETQIWASSACHIQAVTPGEGGEVLFGTPGEGGDFANPLQALMKFNAKIGVQPPGEGGPPTLR